MRSGAAVGHELPADDRDGRGARRASSAPARFWTALLQHAAGLGARPRARDPARRARRDPRRLEPRSPTARCASPIEFLRPIPSVALIPLAVLVYGTGLESKVFLAVFASFWPLFVQTLYGVQDVDPVVTDTARSFGLGRFERIWRIRLPRRRALHRDRRADLLRRRADPRRHRRARDRLGRASGRSISVAQSGGAIDVMYALIIATGMLGWLLNILATQRRAARAALAPLAAGAGGMRRPLAIGAGDHRPDRAARALGRVVGVRRHLLLPAAHGHPAEVPGAVAVRPRRLRRAAEPAAAVPRLR